MDIPPSTPPSPSPLRPRSSAPSPLDSVPPSSSCHTTRPTPKTTSHSTKSKRRAIGIYLKSFFESTRPNLWTLSNFTTYCHSFSGDDAYVWTNGKIYGFYIDYLNKFLTERSPLAPEAKIRQLLQKAQTRAQTRAQPRGSTRPRRGKEKLSTGNNEAASARDSRVSMEFRVLFYARGYGVGLRCSLLTHKVGGIFLQEIPPTPSASAESLIC